MLFFVVLQKSLDANSVRQFNQIFSCTEVQQGRSQDFFRGTHNPPNAPVPRNIYESSSVTVAPTRTF